MRTGFAGLGAMGAPMALNIVASGHEVQVWNRTAAKAAHLIQTGAVTALPCELSRKCGIVITIVSDGPDVRGVAFSPSGLLAEARGGLLWIDCSSIAPQVAIDLTEVGRSAGVEPVDAPVSGGMKGATEEHLSIIVGGTEEGFARPPDPGDPRRQPRGRQRRRPGREAGQPADRRRDDCARLRGHCSGRSAESRSGRRTRGGFCARPAAPPSTGGQ